MLLPFFVHTCDYIAGAMVASTGSNYFQENELLNGRCKVDLRACLFRLFQQCRSVRTDSLEENSKMVDGYLDRVEKLVSISPDSCKNC